MTLLGFLRALMPTKRPSWRNGAFRRSIKKWWGL
jgi:hypothetical protein